jgi:hypothetical protein
LTIDAKSDLSRPAAIAFLQFIIHHMKMVDVTIKIKNITFDNFIGIIYILSFT